MFYTAKVKIIQYKVKHFYYNLYKKSYNFSLQIL